MINLIFNYLFLICWCLHLKNFKFFVIIADLKSIIDYLKLNLDFITCDLYYFIDCFKIKFNYHLLVINHKSNFIYLYLYNFKSDFNFVYFIFLIYLIISFYLFLLIYSKIYFLEFLFIINLIHKASVQNIDSNLLPKFHFFKNLFLNYLRFKIKKRIKLKFTYFSLNCFDFCCISI